jgi:hypothetical protein
MLNQTIAYNYSSFEVTELWRYDEMVCGQDVKSVDSQDIRSRTA